MKTSFGKFAPRKLNTLILCCALAWPGQTVFATGLPVIDVANLAENAVTALKEVAAVAKQIQQYETQLQQYEDQLKQALIPDTFIWEQALQTMNSLRQAIDTLNYYKQQLGSIDAYVGKFKDASGYSSFTCYQNKACTAAEWAQLNINSHLGSESQKKATDALFKGLDKQQDALQKDAATLQSLQSAAQSAEGRMQAIQFANQLASEQANQLLQIRGLLVAEQNVIATRNQALADYEAQQQAASEKHFRTGAFSDRSSAKGF